MNKAIISVDSGGTKTKVSLINANKEIIESVYEGSGSPAVIGIAALENIYRGIEKIYTFASGYQIDYIVIGMSGLMSLPNISEYKQRLESHFKANVLLTNDAELALYSVIKDKYQEGILVLSGTGSAIIGYNQEPHLVGGWGHLLTEVGSAFSVVRTLVVNAIKLYEEKRIVSELTKDFINHLQLKRIEEFRIFMYKNSKREIASHASFINEAANSGNSEAIALLKAEARKIAIDVRNAKRIANLSANAVIGFRGGFISNSEIFKQELMLSLQEMGLAFIFENYEEVDPIFGGYYYAKREGWLC